jgi:hypothetical protein
MVKPSLVLSGFIANKKSSAISCSDFRLPEKAKREAERSLLKDATKGPRGFLPLLISSCLLSGEAKTITLAYSMDLRKKNCH